MTKLDNKKLLSTLLLSSCLSVSAALGDGEIITHNPGSQVDISSHIERLKGCDNLCIDLEEELAMLDQLQEFELGRFLLSNHGLNGFWTSYLISVGPKINLDHPLENWIVNSAPIVRATQERSGVFQKQIQKYLKTNSKIASLPCGAMDDLLALNLDGIHDIKMVGIDLDNESLELAKTNYKPSKNSSAEFLNRDAWHMHISDEFDVLVSNGLNIYVPEDQKVEELYQEFYNSLKDGGVLITSFLTPPPTVSKKSTWMNFDEDALKKQKALFSDILQVKWEQVFRTEDQTREQLEKAGFKVLDIIYDKQGMFPTIVAKKTVVGET